LAVLPVAFGLLGFIEPCSIGATLIFVKAMERNSAAAKVTRVAFFTLSRALFMGALGALATVVGSAFSGFQKAAWMALGALYAALGLLYITGRIGWLMRSFGPGLARLSGNPGSALLGVLLGLNIPACAAPLLIALLGASAAGAVTGGSVLRGFITLGLFGLALSLPLVIAMVFPRGQRALERFAALSRRLPVWTGVLLIALGAWSIWFGTFSSVDGIAPQQTSQNGESGTALDASGLVTWMARATRSVPCTV
jgi:cytochrome c-type biogenesis protein